MSSEPFSPALTLPTDMDANRQDRSDATLLNILELVESHNAIGTGRTIEGSLVGAVQQTLNLAHFDEILVSSEPRWIDRATRMDIAHQLRRGTHRNIQHCEHARY